MIKLSIKDFYNGKYDHDFYSLYIVKDLSDNILYIGISTTNIWERWFGCYGRMRGLKPSDRISNYIIDNLPMSWEWTITLMTKEDCIVELSADIEEIYHHRDFSRFDIDSLEEIFIQKLQPKLNVSRNGVSREEQKRIMEEMAKEIINRKSKVKRVSIAIPF